MWSPSATAAGALPTPSFALNTTYLATLLGVTQMLVLQARGRNESAEMSIFVISELRHSIARFFVTGRFFSAKLLRFGKKRNKFLCFALYFT